MPTLSERGMFWKQSTTQASLEMCAQLNQDIILQTCSLRASERGLDWPHRWDKEIIAGYFSCPLRVINISVRAVPQTLYRSLEMWTVPPKCS
ncbi:rCG57554, isoform CRA_a [Rattus norvegicus]|uniref:RCG57554, isoform CRA_a n=1 Tax=Rattus norvegicus TaxID=10116 RepID=A6JI48_RAT|nr:rCG57554, isoform CRA_a [Rattus norvegicus]EDL94523.1 rCG57554, isoform CRA_a [Rattus norvegicus]EDL94524.1 rCG57554, isoform CRA_a [Rattus norvegicus]